MRLRVAAPLAFAALTLAACRGDSPTDSGTGMLPFTVSGAIENLTTTAIPEGARVYVLWGVSSGSPDYNYVYGEGTVDRATNRFTITFDAAPPAEALNQPGGLGVGLVLVTTSEGLPSGRLPGDFDTSHVIGASGQHAVIYQAGTPASAPVSWMRRFARGYNVGQGITIPGSAYDGYEPASADAVRVIVDDLANIQFVNWT